MFQSAFQSTLPARGATHCSLREHCSNSAFQSTLPARGATAERWPLLSELQYFNPRSPHGERRSTTAGATCRTYFNPRSPHGERPVYFQCAWRNDGISIHAPRTGSDGVIGVPCAAAVISIHAPRTGSDDRPESGSVLPGISIHAPRTGSDDRPESGSVLPGISIHAPRTGSDGVNIFQVFEPGISIHAPRTGSDAHVGAGRPDCGISIHAPRTGSDWTSGRVSIKRYNISIHAPRTGSDRTTRQSQYIAAHFNPRSPHGERRYPQVARTLTAISIHAPRTGSDDLCASDGLLLHISIHAPRTGSDSRLRHSYPAGRHFNPRSPHGERLCALCIRTLTARFQSTLPARGATGL